MLAEAPVLLPIDNSRRNKKVFVHNLSRLQAIFTSNLNAKLTQNGFQPAPLYLFNIGVGLTTILSSWRLAVMSNFTSFSGRQHSFGRITEIHENSVAQNPRWAAVNHYRWQLIPFAGASFSTAIVNVSSQFAFGEQFSLYLSRLPNQLQVRSRQFFWQLGLQST